MEKQVKSGGNQDFRKQELLREQEKKLGIPRVAVACNGPTTPYGDLQAARNSTGLSEFDYGMEEYGSTGSLEAMHALVRAFWEAESQRKDTAHLSLLMVILLS